jgi:hypothetical protein
LVAAAAVVQVAVVDVREQVAVAVVQTLVVVEMVVTHHALHVLAQGVEAAEHLESFVEALF